MSNIIKSHFYVVNGTPKGETFPTMGWLFHSYKELEAYLPNEDFPCFETGEHTFPTEDEQGEVAATYEKWLKDNK